MAITAAQVKELRERTGAGMMDCKKALQETDGDLEKAVELMRKSGQAKADKKAGRVAAEGVVNILASSDEKDAIIVEVNCETDFVARDENFLNFVNTMSDIALKNKITDVDALATAQFSADKNVEQARKELVAKIGENVKVRRLSHIHSDGHLGRYIHGGRIAVVVALEGGDADLAKDLAMHIAANNPIVVSQTEVPAESVAKEKDIFMAQAENSGKPKEIIEKMVEGRIRKFVDEVSLLGQAFVKDPNTKVEKLLEQHKAKVLSFIRFEVGEGIEKEESNFAEEVMAQVKGEA